MVKDRVATDDMPNFEGQVIDDGRFELLESLGTGAYGKVYRALDRSSPPDQPAYYAVKCLLRHDFGTRHDKFQRREFAVQQQVCDHPNILTLHRVIYDKDFVYVVLDLCAGDLFAIITETDMLNDVALVKQWFVQLIDAVQHCHDCSVFHRDLKPENILCAADGSGIRLADFGLCTRKFVSKDFGCGSTHYMSPECIGPEVSFGRYSTRHNDIWALGVILINMISCRNPWRHATPDDESFTSYLNNADYLRNSLSISEGASNILNRIFNMNPLRRISLQDLRREILALDTFLGEKPSPAHNQPSRINKVLGTVPDESLMVFKTRTSLKAHVSDGLCEAHTLSSLRINCSPSLVSPEPSSQRSHWSGSSSSSADSGGPITPQTYPVNPDIEVPDLPEGESLGEPAGLFIPDKVNRLVVPTSRTPSIQEGKSKHRRMLHKALGRLRVMHI